MVVEITRDIKALDHGKKNISNTIGAITKLQMLDSVLDKLKNLIDQKQFSEVANLLNVSMDLDIYFKNYKDIPKVKSLNEQLTAVKEKLRHLLLTEFRTMEENFEFRGEKLYDACCAVDSIGSNFRTEVIAQYTKQQVYQYKEKFSANAKDLNDVQPRFNWLRNKLKDIKANYKDSVPPNWNLSQEISVEFILSTREIFKEMLKASEASSFYNSLKDSIRFEKELSERFSETKNYNFKGLLSKAFDEFMEVYLKDQNTLMINKLNQFLKNERWAVNSTTNSAEDLFIFITSSLDSCMVINTGIILFNLINIWKKNIHAYADQLFERLPKGQKEKTGFDISSFLNWQTESQSSNQKLSEKEQMLVCYIIRLCQFCQKTLKDLSLVLEDKIDQDFKKKIDFEKEKTKFSQTLTASVQILILHLLTHVDEQFEQMSKVSWSTFDQEIQDSEYITEMLKRFSTLLKSILEKLTPYHYSKLCENFIVKFFGRVLLTIKKIKRITNPGTHQLLYDLEILKKFFLSLSENFDPDQSSIYSKIVHSQASKCESILKVVMSPADVLLDSYQSLVKNKSIEELTLILEMKGIPKQEHASILSKFQK
jgi:vacuolar protein sorting-associated protein 53